MFSDLAKRHSRRGLMVEFNPYQILVAEIDRPHRDVVVLESAAEFDRNDSYGLGRWLEGRAWTRTICGLVPQRGIVQRETLNPKRLAEPGYLAEVIEDQQKGRFLSATPFKVLNPDVWSLRAVNAVSGRAVEPETASQAAVICGMANDEVHDVQQRLLDNRLIPERVESGLLSLFGAVYRNLATRPDSGAVAIIVIHQVATTVYILGKEGVHTPGPVFHGFASIVELARKDLGLTEDADVRSRLHNADPLLLKHADRLVRRIGRDVKPVMDSYEMTTGQPIDEIFCAYLPAKLSWISEPLAKVTGRAAMVLDSNQWLQAAGLQVGEDVPAFGPHWLGALSLVATDAGVASATERGDRDDSAAHRPWHVDYRITEGSAEDKAAGRRLLAGTVAAAFAFFAIALTSWQLYAGSTLRTDLHYWEQQLKENKKLFDDLTTASASKEKQSATLKRAYELMGASYQPTTFVASLSRTIPTHMRVDRIETNDVYASISGSLMEPAEEATGTLGRYMEELRRNPAIGPLFSNISITSLHRKSDADAVAFVITLRHNPARL